MTKKFQFESSFQVECLLAQTILQCTGEYEKTFDLERSFKRYFVYELNNVKKCRGINIKLNEISITLDI